MQTNVGGPGVTPPGVLGASDSEEDPVGGVDEGGIESLEGFEDAPGEELAISLLVVAPGGAVVAIDVSNVETSTAVVVGSSVVDGTRNKMCFILLSIFRWKMGA